MDVLQFSHDEFLFKLRIRNLIREDVWKSLNEDPYNPKKRIQITKSYQKQEYNFSFSREDNEVIENDDDRLTGLWNFIQDYSDILSVCKPKDDRDRGNPFISDDLIIQSAL